MKTIVSIYEAKANLSRLIEQVQKEGQPVTISKHGKPVADLVPRKPIKNRLEQDPRLKGAAVYIGDPLAPLDEEDWPDAMK
jgi:prevent-host-death family protein